MEAAEYQRMADAEERHFWFRGSRTVIFTWLDVALADLAAGTASPPITLLDVGAGTGGTLAAIASRFNGLSASGVEISPIALALARQRGADVTAGALPDLPVHSHSVDIALALDVFEHVEDDIAAMRDVRRVLRPGGRLIATVPALAWLWSEHDVALHHYRRYDRNLLVERLRMAGFVVRRVSYYNAALLAPIAAVRLAARLRRGPARAARSDLAPLPAWINEPLAALFGAERFVLARMALPLGASLIVDAVQEPPPEFSPAADSGCKSRRKEASD